MESDLGHIDGSKVPRQRWELVVLLSVGFVAGFVIGGMVGGVLGCPVGWWVGKSAELGAGEH